LKIFVENFCRELKIFRPKYEGQFLNDHPHGSHCVFYDESNQPEYIGGYDRGLKEGPATDYLSNGLVLFEGNYQQGKRHGKDCAAYWDNGNIKFRGGYDMGIYNGYGTEFYKSGPIKYQGHYWEGHYDGDCCQVLWPEGHLAFEGRMIRGVKVGLCKEWYQNGSLMYEFDYGDPRKRSHFSSQLGMARCPDDQKSSYVNDHMKSIRKMSAPPKDQAPWRDAPGPKAPRESSLALVAKPKRSCIEMSENFGVDHLSVDKLYWRNGYLKFIGFVDKEKKKNGRGKYFDVSGNLYFIGTFRDNRFEGRKNFYYYCNNMLKFKGESWNGKLFFPKNL
jgi:antitoxin component YwqK of YwqJK toxin-antitoxin module